MSRVSMSWMWLNNSNELLEYLKVNRRILLLFTLIPPKYTYLFQFSLISSIQTIEGNAVEND